MQIARDLNIPIVEQMIPREMLYIADEVFFTGTAAEVTPIGSVDKIKVGDGKMGPITPDIAERVLCDRARREDGPPWLAYAGARSRKAAGRAYNSTRQSEAGGAPAPPLVSQPEKNKTKSCEGEQLCPKV